MPERIERRGRPRKWTSNPLAKWMIASGIRAEDLADEIEVDLSNVYRWFRGVSFPSTSKALAIAEIARRSGRTLSLEDILNPRRRLTTHDEDPRNGVFSKAATETRGRRLATATK